MKKLFFVLALIISVASGAYSQQKVAVYVTGDQEEGVKKVLGSKMVTYITQSSGFTAVERTADFLSALNDEHDYQVSGEVSNSQIVKLGEQFGARYVAVVDVADVYGDLFVSSRLIDVQTAQIASSYEASGQGGSLSALTYLANDVADGLILGPERKKQEQIRLAQIKKENEARQAREQERALQAQKQAELRKRAIANLMPNDAIVCGPYLVINRLISIESIYDAASQKFSWRPIGNIPPGFQIIDDGTLEYLRINQFQLGQPFYNTFHGHNIVFTGSFIKREYENRGKKNEIIIFKVCAQSMYSFFSRGYYSIGRLSKTKTGWDATPSTTELFTIAYRPNFTEEEIEAEMRRLSR